QYLRARRFFWNSGMFFWKASTIQRALQRYLPATAEVLAKIGRRAAQAGLLPKAVRDALRELYPACENISVDYAVLEKAQRVIGIPCDIGWSDVESWNAVYDLLPRDPQRNVLRTDS